MDSFVFQRFGFPEGIGFSYRGLHLAGTAGKVEARLDGLMANLASANLEIAPVREEPRFERHFGAAVCFEPFADITFAQTYDGTLSVAVATLDRDKTIRLVRELNQTLRMGGFREKKIVFGFLEGMKALWARSYEMARVAAKGYECSVNNAFNTMCYANLLHQYRGVNFEEATERAKRRFGIAR